MREQLETLGFLVSDKDAVFILYRLSVTYADYSEVPVDTLKKTIFQILQDYRITYYRENPNFQTTQSLYHDDWV